MMRRMNVEQAAKLFFQLEDEGDSQLETEEEDEVAMLRSKLRSKRRCATARSRSPRGDAEPLSRCDPWKTEKRHKKVPAMANTRSPNKQPVFPYENNLEKYKWNDIEVEDLYKLFGLMIYMSLVSLPSLYDYWTILSVPLPHKVMFRDKFRSIFWNTHLSDPEEDEQNDKKGTPGHEKLFRIRPLYDDILCSCKAYFHPKRELAVDEMMVGTKAKTGITEYMKDKPTKWGLKNFVLHGLSYDVVMNLVQTSFRDTEYRIYMDNFYSSPNLFMDLSRMKFGACGTYSSLRGRGNALTKKSKRGSVRWIREGSLVFVKWMDTHEVSVCSTIHPAFSGETVDRRAKAADGSWAVSKIPCPTPIVAYNKNTVWVEKTNRWYTTLLLHFLDIATTNAVILHREISSTKQEEVMTHKDFMVELMCQLCGINHVPVAISTATDSAQKASKGRLKCKHCLQYKMQYKIRHNTPWKCQACDVPPWTESVSWSGTNNFYYLV
uniref:PiggyBac transposable element-derived protein domain-containing protein n=1 Tax=Xiphophorus couchianus TaxID=32473 RepID=A0A3B5M8V3_9TELE